MKYIIRVCLVLSVLLTIAGIGVGHYFVGYALGPSSSSADRVVVNEDAVEVSADAAETAAVKSRVEENTKLLMEKKAQWLAQTQLQTAAQTSADGLSLEAEYAVADGHKWAILIHGYKSDRHMMEVYAMEYSARGYHVLLPDNRACGNSEGDYIGMGWLDKEDISVWIDWIIGQDEEAQIVLHGVSMGGATVMMVSGEELPAQVTAFVEDCGYTSVWDIFSSELKARFSLPSFPILDVTSLYAKVVAGYGFREASALDQLKKNDRPMLFIHGGADDFVPTWMVYTLYEAADCRKELYVAEGAGHAMSIYADPDTYWETVFSFLES